jgi:hypothetical protein
MATVSSIYYIIGADINVGFAKYRDNPELKIKETTLPRGTNSIIRICYSKISNRPTNILWTNGNCFMIFTVPDYD